MGNSLDTTEREEKAMSIRRMYTGDDNETHIEELSPEAHPELASLQDVSGIRIQISKGGRFSDFHPAPERRWLVVLAGLIEIGLGDGTIQHFGPGDLWLIEDVTGHGHTTRHLRPTVSAVMPIPD